MHRTHLYGAVLSLLSLACVNAFIIPEELPTLLSVIYSNIPPLKLGFDTRFGFGFRIGPHADFQTIIELGPQQNTAPLGMGNDTVAKRSQTRAETKLYRKAGELAPEPDTNENEAVQPTLAEILFGRKGSKRVKSYKDEIEFKKVPGIDDMKKSKPSKAVVAKRGKLQEGKSPTKVVIFR